ncbi:hypothetical protein G7046_g9656 [Stylonectria norvegica]|nr:hypothetical protein G7046_g9656 [Stylonectria norvegica]
MGRRRAEDAAVALLRSASTATASTIFRPHHCPPAAWRCLATLTSRFSPRRQLSRHASTNTLPRCRSYATEAKDARFAVLGGGLTGLTTAYYLAKQLPPSARITIYEGGDRLGGWIRTDKVPVDLGGKQGTVSFERGPRSLSSLAGSTWRYDDLVLYDLALDLGLKLEAAPDKARYIYYPDHLVALPPAVGLVQMIKEPLFTEAMWGGLGLLLRAFRNNQLPTEDQSVADWIQEISWSRAAADNFASAMVHGIYGGDIDKLSARSVLDRIYWGWYLPSAGPEARPMPYPDRDLLRTLGQDKEIQKLALKPKGSLIHFGPAGMQSLTDALTAALEAQPNIDIKLNTSVKQLSYDEAEQTINISGSKPDSLPETYDKVISTLSSQSLASITQRTSSPPASAT